MRRILLLWLCFAQIFWVIGQTDRSTLEGRILSKDGTGIPGANILLKNSNTGTISDIDGNFSLSLPLGEAVLEVSYIGYDSKEVAVSIPFSGTLEISLEEDGISLSAIEVVSTGYQQLPRERSTGSFVQLDETLVNRRVSTNILDRIEDISPGVLFARNNRGGLEGVQVRGNSTIFANRDPLIIIDNFPYDGPLENINPNDVESITVLKDAAAASIWGARAGNGVIVITTKRGKAGSPKVSINSNYNLIEQPDLFHRQMMGLDEFVDFEQELFGRGFYTARENSPQRLILPPAVETMILGRDGVISQAETARRLEQHRSSDIRRDLERYYYRPALNRQYSINVSGGGEYHRYQTSVGYDSNRESVVDQSNSRLTINSQNSWSLLNQRLDIGAGMYYTLGNREQRSQLPQGVYSPYASLSDSDGNPAMLPVDYRSTFVAAAPGLGLLDWAYRPLEEQGNYLNRQVQNDLRLNFLVGYKILDGLRAEASYQYWNNQGRNKELHAADSYFTRNLINTFSRIDPANGNVIREVPEGEIFNLGESSAYSHNLRLKLDYQKSWASGHEVVALAGWEVRDFQSLGNTARYYGYDDMYGTSLPVNLNTRFNQFANNILLNIPSGASHSGVIDRFVSGFSNASYSYKKRYTLTASARRDASNLFGVSANQKWVPLWSVGGGWVISNEKFYNVDWLPYLRLKTTYGYNGNIDPSLSAFTTARISSGGQNALSGLQFLQIVNPPNPELRWERIGITNIGAEFESRNSRIRGSFEYFVKNASDLIGTRMFPSTSGVTSFTGNFADMRTRGFDFEVSTHNIRGKFNWRSFFLLSRTVDKVTRYENEASINQYFSYGAGNPGFRPQPREGFPLNSVFALAWGGLDPDNGAPRGVLDGEPSANHSAVYSQTAVEDMVFFGSDRPQTFGAIRNDFSYGGFSVSVNISYRMDYYFRGDPINYGNLYSGRLQPTEYSQRWQQPGDELVTNVPSVPAASNFFRDFVYINSEINVFRGDHIRLQDVRLSYVFERSKFARLPFERAELYGYANQLGVIWRKNDRFMDPDYRIDNALRSFAFGVRVDF
ncbi:TonB-dependent receptor [Indibacter alkaliphilus LW1]|uniref:TonB-dependent receptor n=1 Tax=Indibacter alkaliphilus (strain CCUG 57479 / KCTC 22604 / LW1) TaxID=1189612 RepID=S2DP75_INDAL|nr:SusC/RagA family TonB-linked outer membrane protein [Indibacter alkaliphilus]EOZ93771.1 TonB-dependent receptor [Indibacter alkaliphilus LW1]